MQALHKFIEKPRNDEIKNRNLESLEFDKTIKALETYLKNISETKQKPSLEEHEKMIVQLVHQIGRKAMEVTLSQYDVSSDLITVGNQTYRKINKAAKTYQTLMGEVRIERHLYSNRKKDGDGKCICPLELQAGIIEGYWTSMAAKSALWMLSHLPPQEVEELLLQLKIMNPSRSSLDRLPKAIQTYWEPKNRAYIEEMIQEEEIPKEATTIATSLDGVMVAMRGEKKVKDTVSRVEWHEASCGTISFFDKDGERLSTIQYGRMPESKKVTLKTLLRKNVEVIQKKHPELKLVHVADGAKDNWSFFEEEMPVGFEVVDFYHACEYLKKGFEAAYIKEPEKSREQFHKYKAILRDEENGVERTLRALRYLRDIEPESKMIHDAITYFSNNQHRMKYYEARKLNYPIGSGVVEATCKTLVAQRLKRSGMSWCQHGGQAILTFRALIKSNRFDKAWDRVAIQYKQTVFIHDNVFLFPGENLN